MSCSFAFIDKRCDAMLMVQPICKGRCGIANSAKIGPGEVQAHHGALGQSQSLNQASHLKAAIKIKWQNTIKK